MTDLTSSTSIPAIIIFGEDEKGRPHASYFEQTDLTAAEKAASVMGMRSLITSSEDERALAAELPRGRVFVSGRAFVPFVGARLHRRLKAAVRAKVANTTTMTGNTSLDRPDNLPGAQPAVTTAGEPVCAFEPPGAVSVPPAAETEPAAGFWPANCQSALDQDPVSASKRDPFERRVRVVALAPSELAGVAETGRARFG